MREEKEKKLREKEERKLEKRVMKGEREKERERRNTVYKDHSFSTIDELSSGSISSSGNVSTFPGNRKERRANTLRESFSSPPSSPLDDSNNNLTIYNINHINNNNNNSSTNTSNNSSISSLSSSSSTSSASALSSTSGRRTPRDDKDRKEEKKEKEKEREIIINKKDGELEQLLVGWLIDWLVILSI